MTNETKVGLLVVCALAILVTTFLYVANVQLTGETHAYRTYFSYIGGLDEGSAVRFGGRKVGTIQSVRPSREDMTRTEVLFALRAEVPVNRESVATIASLNALGQNYLEVLPGSIDAPRIEPGGVVPSAEALTFSDLTRKVAEVADTAVDLMGRIDLKMTLVADDLHDVMVNLKDLSGERNRRNIARMLANSNELIETQSPKIDRITTQLSETLERVENLAAEFRQVARTADTALAGLDRSVEETREPMKRTLAELEAAMAGARLVLGDARALLLLNEANVAEIVENFRSASEDIEALSADLRQRPWTLIRSRPKPDRQVPATAGGPGR